LKRNKARIAALAKENQKAGVCLTSNKGGKGVNTLERLAALAGVSRDYMYKAEFILARAADEPTNEIIQEKLVALRKGTDGISVNKVHKELWKNTEERKKRTQQPKSDSTADSTSNDVEKETLVQTGLPMEDVPDVTEPIHTFHEYHYAKERWMNSKDWLTQILFYLERELEKEYKYPAYRLDIYKGIRRWTDERIADLS